ncbi:DUF6508 domain-containing protein [Paenisporosarcina quisquiliarum]|uniref:DUF6508 domain-containing protein n=1 Tax=Paenisporosarcina quisquiliarum TaxID=365346 RepID=A0A9X3LGR3_9BACL|nr:DUF6508 domain-containing protein [Paenisporosarcina quisquiliarum]MCZ8537100.1 DUF6508 domain-containing protein [Paenisporosarcina quisquiliarum]
MLGNNYENLFGYIKYFENDNLEFYKWQSTKREDGVITMSYPVYDKKLREFIQDVYDSGIMLNDYQSLVSSDISTGDDAIILINNTDNSEKLRALLTYFVRQERFSEGSWAEAANKRIFLSILLKLKSMGEEC